MNNTKRQYMTAFNSHLIEFAEDIRRVFPDDMDIASAENGLKKLKKANPKLLISLFKEHISDKYNDEIEKGDVNFFVETDFSKDIPKDKSMFVDKINSFKKPVANMDNENKEKIVKYMKNLNTLSKLYFS